MVGGLWDYARRLFGGSDYEVVGPDEPMSPEEARILFPRGVPDAQHRGGLGELAAAALRSGADTASQAKRTAAGDTERQEPRAEIQKREGGPGVHWYMGGIAERAELGKEDRELGAVENIGRFVGTLARLAATYGAGGAMGGGLGGATGGGAAAGGSGAVAGAGAAGGGTAGMWGSFLGGLTGSGGEGWAGMLGRGARGMAESQAKGSLRQQSDAIADAVGTLTGRTQRRQAMWDLYLNRPAWWYY